MSFDFFLEIGDLADFVEENETVFVCLFVASHISETSEGIAITFDTMTASVMRMHHASFFGSLSEVNSTIIMQEYTQMTQSPE